MTDLPANVDVTSILDSSQFPKEQPKEVSFKLNELRCDMAKLYEWYKYEGYTAYVKDVDGDNYPVHQLHHAISGSDCRWKYPHVDDVQEAELDQIIDYSVEGH